jgi:hypothetical protein
MIVIIALLSSIVSLAYMAVNDIFDYMMIYVILMACCISCFFGIGDYVTAMEILNSDNKNYMIDIMTEKL